MTDATRDGYSEVLDEGVVNDPFTFGAFTQKRTSSIFGLRIDGAVGPKFTYRFGVGGEYDMNYSLNGFTVSGSDFGTVAYASSVIPRDFRMNGYGGIGVALDDSKTLTLSGSAQQSDVGNDLAYTVLTGLQMRF